MIAELALAMSDIEVRWDPDRLARQLDAACTNPARLLTTGQEIDDE